MHLRHYRQWSTFFSPKKRSKTNKMAKCRHTMTTTMCFAFFAFILFIFIFFRLKILISVSFVYFFKKSFRVCWLLLLSILLNFFRPHAIWAFAQRRNTKKENSKKSDVILKKILKSNEKMGVSDSKKKKIVCKCIRVSLSICVMCSHCSVCYLLHLFVYIQNV